MFSENDSSKIFKYKLILLILVILLIITYLYVNYKYAKKNEPILVYNKTLFNDNKKLRPVNIEKSKEGIQLTYNLWFYIKNAPENAAWNSSFKSPKVILSQGYSPAIAIIPFSNKLIFGITSACQYYTYEISYIPSQKWTNIIMILNNRTVDFFINSKLLKSIMLPYIPDINTQLIDFFPDNDKLFGYIANARYYNRALSKQEVIALYDSNKNNNPPETSTFWWLPKQTTSEFFLTTLNNLLYLPKNIMNILF